MASSSSIIKKRGWCYTLNNPTEEMVNLFMGIEAQYHVFGREVGASGNPHLQGYIYFANARSFDSVKKLLPLAHIEPAATIDEAIAYCKKDGDVWEQGKAPMGRKEQGDKGKDAEQSRWEDAVALSKEGRFEEVDAQIQVCHGGGLDRIYMAALASKPREDTGQVHLWYYGGTGTGKSRKAREENPGAYEKMCNKWWDHYKDQPVVLIEDFDRDHKVLGHHLKIWADRYPFLAEIKGNTRRVRPQLIIVTSNYSIDEIWGDSPETAEPLHRRFHQVHFTNINN